MTGEIFRRQLGRGWFIVCTVVTAVLLLVSVALPVQQLAASSRTWSELPNLFRAAPDTVWNSFAFAAVAASLCVAGSLLVQELACARPSRSRRREEADGSSLSRVRLLTSAATCVTKPAGLLLWLPFLIPGVITYQKDPLLYKISIEGVCLHFSPQSK